jgi:hypothetical protein
MTHFSIKSPLVRPVSAQVLAYMVLAVAALSFITGVILSHGLQVDGHWPDYNDMVGQLDRPVAWMRWVLGDLSEFVFFKHELAGLGLLAGAGLGWWANRSGWRWQGFAIAYGSGLWPWLATSALLGLALSNLLWGWTVSAQAWQPTFVPFVSLPAAMVLVFGRGWKVAITGAVLGAVLVAPASLLLVNYLCVPRGLPNVVGAVGGMGIASILAFGLCRIYPCLVKPAIPVAARRMPPPQPPETRFGLFWGARRVLADFSEAPFFGNEWASLGLLAGVLLAYGLNPDSTVYGSGLLLPILTAQTLASAFGIALWRRQWMRDGWYPTYIPVVSVAPTAVLVHGGGWAVILLSAILGALIAPPLAKWASGYLPAWMHGFIANVFSMAASTLVILPIVGWALSALEVL